MRADGAPYAEVAAVAQRIAEGGEDWDAAKIQAMNLVPDEYRGLDRFEARERVVADITVEGLAVMVPGEDGEMVPLVENKTIMQPFGDRSGVVIEPRLTDQWFVDAGALSKEARAAVEDGRTHFVPDNWSKTYFNWLDNIEPWCISRQLWWGHRIPAWYGPDVPQGGILANSDEGSKALDKLKIFVAHSWDEAAEQAIEYYDLHDSISPDRVTEADETEGYRSVGFGISAQLEGGGGKVSRVTLSRPRRPRHLVLLRALAVLDPGLAEETRNWKRFYPGAVLVTAFDIIFFWVARMMMMGLQFPRGRGRQTRCRSATSISTPSCWTKRARR